VKLPTFNYSKTTEYTIAGLGIFAVLFVVNPDVFLIKTGLLANDFRLQDFPLASLLAQQWRTGHLSLWTNLMGCGFPIFAEGQIAPLYPLNFIFYRLLPLPFELAYNYFALFQYWLSGMLFYLYVRNLKLSRPGAWVACLVFLFGACQGGYFCNSNVQKVVTWFPLVLLLIDRFWVDRNNLYFLWIGAIIGIQINSGHPQSLIYATGFSFFYYSMRLFENHPGLDGPAKARMVLLHGMQVAVIGLSIGLPQLLATSELTAFTNRLSLPEKFAYVGSMPPQGFLTFFFPFLGAYLGPATLYMSVFALLLVVMAGLGRATWDKRLWALFWMGVLSILVALGQYDPLYKLFIKLTHFYSLRVPSRITYFLGIVLAVLAGWGWDHLRSIIRIEGKTRKAIKVFIGVAAIAFFVTGLLEPLVRLLLPVLNQWGTEVIKKHFTGDLLHPHSFAVYQTKLQTFLQGLITASSLRENPKAFKWMFILGFNIIVAVSVLKTSFKYRKYVLMSSLAVLLFDLFSFNAFGGFRSQLLAFKQKQEIEKPWAEVLPQDKAQCRIYEYCTNLNQRELFPIFFNSGVTYRISDVGIYTPLTLERHRNYFEGLGANDNSISLAVADPERFAKLRPLLDLAGAKYMISPTEPPDAGWVERFKRDGFILYENQQVLPRAYGLPRQNFKVVDNFNEYAGTGLLNPRGEVVFEKGMSGTDVAPDASHKPDVIRAVRIVEALDEKVVLETNWSGPGWLILNDAYYPGWKASVNGEETEIYRANGLFRAIRVSGGEQRVEFAYSPKYKSLLWLPWASLGLLGLFSVGAAVRKRNCAQP